MSAACGSGGLRCLGLALVCALAAAACHARRPLVEVPPRVDLTRWQSIGLIDIDVRGERELGASATESFVRAIQEAQTGVPLLELGSRRDVLAEVGRSELDLQAVRAIGERYGVDALLVGSVELTQSLPELRVSSRLRAVEAQARVLGSFHGRLLSTQSGATVWTPHAEGARSLAALRARKDRGVDLRAEDTRAVHTTLIRTLTREAAADLRATWRR